MKIDKYLRYVITLIIIKLIILFCNNYVWTNGGNEYWQIIKYFDIVSTLLIYGYLFIFIKRHKKQNFSTIAFVILTLSVSNILLYILPKDSLYSLINTPQTTFWSYFKNGLHIWLQMIAASIIAIQFIRNNVVDKTTNTNIIIVGYSFIITLVLGPLIVQLFFGFTISYLLSLLPQLALLNLFINDYKKSTKFKNTVHS